MYGVITTVPAPVEMYDGMHAEMIRRAGTSIDGLLVHVGRATHRRLRGAGSLGVQGALRPRQHRHRLPPDAGTGWRSAFAFDRASNRSLRRPWACHSAWQHPDLADLARRHRKADSAPTGAPTGRLQPVQTFRRHTTGVPPPVPALISSSAQTSPNV